MEKLKWSMPGEAIGTIMFPALEYRHTIVAVFRPGNQHEDAVRAFIGDSSNSDDRVSIEHFDHILNRFQENDRIIHVELLHEPEAFEIFIAFSFVGSLGNPGAVFPVTTNSSGITLVDFEVEL